jgi:GT2 family glycosyltransferase
MKKVLISLVTYKNHEVLKRCLDSIAELNHDNLSLAIKVVNNDTEKEFQYAVKGLEVAVHNQKKNIGFAGGHNINLKKAITEKVDFVLVLNDDTKLEKNSLSELVHAAEENSQGGIFAPKIYFTRGNEFHKEKYKKDELGKVIWYAGGNIDWQNLIISHRGVDEVDTGQFDTVEETAFASGCCMLIRGEVLEEAGLFDERYFLYLEDSDLNERIKKRGKKVFFVPKSILWHENAGSTGGSGSSLQDYYISRNRMLFGFTYAPLRTKSALLRESLQLLRHGREWQRKGIKDFYLRRLGKGSYRV